MNNCQFHTEEEPGCSRRALPGKEFCGPHSRVAGSVAELEEAQALGPGTGPEIAEQLAMAEAGARFAGGGEVEKAAAQAVKPRRKREAAPVDPETLGSQLAEQLVAMEAAERLQRARARERNQYSVKKGHLGADGDAEAGEAPTYKVRPRRARADSTRMVDQNGKPLVRPGWVPRWVRQTDALGRPSESRVEEFKDFGYEVVVDPKTGKPLTGHFGVAMQAPPQQYALRVKECSAPGALDRADLYEDARLAIEEANEHAGDEIARFVEDPSHKYSRKWHGPTVEVAD